MPSWSEREPRLRRSERSEMRTGRLTLALAALILAMLVTTSALGAQGRALGAAEVRGGAKAVAGGWSGKARNALRVFGFSSGLSESEIHEKKGKECAAAPPNQGS